MTTTTVRLAFASSDRKRVDQHFGSACGLAIYAVNEQQATLLEFAQFGDLEQDGHEQADHQAGAGPRLRCGVLPSDRRFRHPAIAGRRGATDPGRGKRTSRATAE